MLNLKENPTLSDYQEYVVSLEKERNFFDENILQKCLLLGEEIGELYGAFIEFDSQNSSFNNKNITDELADVLIVLCAIANRLEINMSAAIIANFVDARDLTLPMLQQKVKDNKSLTSQSAYIDYLRLGSDIGHLFKTIRKRGQILKLDNNSVFIKANEAVIKCICSLCVVANKFTIDLEAAFRDKEQVNKQRIWQ